MPNITIRFYAELNDALPEELRYRTSRHHVENGTRVRSFIRALGASDADVDLVLANDEPVEVEHIVQDGERISVYPVFETFDISPLLGNGRSPRRETRFVADVHLGRLAHYLRFLGFDTCYRNDYSDDELVAISRRQRRVILTRDRALLTRKEVTHGYRVLAIRPPEQVVEVVRRFDLARQVTPFRRCSRCNTLVHPIDREALAGRVPAAVLEIRDSFTRCPSCERIYWRGTHAEQLQRFFAALLAIEPPSR